MAVDETTYPWTYSAAADESYHVGRIPLSKIVLWNGAGVANTIEVLDGSGGKCLFRANVGSWGTAERDFPPGFFTSGIYINLLPTNCRVDVFPRGHGYG